MLNKNSVNTNQCKVIAFELAIIHSTSLTTLTPHSKLPEGITRADLFKDNTLFEHDHLSGIFDFYDACYDNTNPWEYQRSFLNHIKPVIAALA